MEKKDKYIIKAKIVIGLQALLARFRKSNDIKDEDKSYNEIAFNSNMRKATISDNFNGNNSPKSDTLISIVNAMGFQLSDFAAEFDSISDADAKKFKLPPPKKKKKKD